MLVLTVIYKLLKAFFLAFSLSLFGSNVISQNMFSVKAFQSENTAKIKDCYEYETTIKILKNMFILPSNNDTQKTFFSKIT